MVTYKEYREAMITIREYKEQLSVSDEHFYRLESKVVSERLWHALDTYYRNYQSEQNWPMKMFSELPIINLEEFKGMVNVNVDDEMYLELINLCTKFPIKTK